MKTCALCFGRGYKGGGKCPTCRRCEGRGEVPDDHRNRDPWGWDPVKGTTYNGRPVDPKPGDGSAPRGGGR